MSDSGAGGWIGTVLFIGGVLLFNLLSYLFNWGWVVY